MSTIIALLLTYQTWKLRPARGTGLWSTLMFFAAIYAFGTGFEAQLIAPEWKYGAIPIIYLGLTGMIFLWGIFCISFSNHDHWLNRTTIGLMSVIPVIVFLTSLTAQHHTLLYQSVEFVNLNGLILMDIVSHGTIFWIWVVYIYAVLALGGLLLIRSAMNQPELFQGQALIVILSISVSLFASLFYVLGFNPIDPFDTTPLSLTVSGLIMFVAMKRYRFLDILPIAYDLVFDNVNSAVFIIDMRLRLVDMNNSATRILNQPHEKLIGLPIEHAFASNTELLAIFEDMSVTRQEITIGQHPYRTPSKKYHGDGIYPHAV